MWPCRFWRPSWTIPRTLRSWPWMLPRTTRRIIATRGTWTGWRPSARTSRRAWRTSSRPSRRGGHQRCDHGASDIAREQRRGLNEAIEAENLRVALCEAEHSYGRTSISSCMRTLITQRRTCSCRSTSSTRYTSARPAS